MAQRSTFFALLALAASLCAGLTACSETRTSPIDGGPPALSAAPLARTTASAAPPRPSPASSSEDPGAAARKSPCPEGMAHIDRYCVDRYEAHLVSRSASGERALHPHFLRPEEGVAYEARSAPGVFPQAYISRVESEAACAAAGKRLCTRREWQRACRYRADGKTAVTYPYGDRWLPDRCNADKPHLLTLRFGADPRRWRYAEFNDPALAQEPGFLAKSGAYSGCVGDAEVYDMVGNLHEWVSDTADTAFEARIRTEGISRAFQYWSPGNGVFMGGFFSTHGELGPGCTFTTIAHEPRYHDYSTGFRCCSDASGG